MVVSDLANVAQALRQLGFEARNLNQVGITVWRNGHGLFLSVDDIRSLNGNIVQELDELLKKERPQ
jgi:hypothetical protein